MNNIIIITYSQSPLKCLMPYFALQDHIQVLDEKFTQFDQLKGQEIWLDTYLDLYDPRLINPDYLYQFFARIHKICDQIKSPKIRFFQNFTYTTTYTPLKKVFYLYQSFVQFFPKAYDGIPIVLPDILDSSYRYHPFNQLKNSKAPILWSNNSLFRIIHKNDIVSNLMDNILGEEMVILSGLKVSILDLYNKVSQIFGKNDTPLDNAYEIIINDNIQGQILSDINYNLESICITQL